MDINAIVSCNPLVCNSSYEIYTKEMKQFKVTLRQTQWRPGDKWEFTMRGEKKLLPFRLVSFYAQDDEDIASLINLDEIEDITPDIYPPIVYLPDSDQFRVHKRKKMPYSNMDIMTNWKDDGDFVLISIVFGCTSEENPLYRLKLAETFNPINTEK